MSSSSTITLEKLQSFEVALLKQASLFAAKDHNDGHRYTVVSAAIETNLIYGLSVRIRLDVKYWDRGLDEEEDEPFEDDYDFIYPITAADRVLYVPPHVPLSQEQVFRSHKLWVKVVRSWLKTIIYYFNRQEQLKAAVHQALIARMWSSERVGGMLETGGWDLVEAS